jgi:hypothetical protein
MLYLRSLNRFILVGLALLGLSVSSVSASVVFFDYSGSGTGEIASGSFSLDDSLFNGGNFQPILQSNLLTFSFTDSNSGSSNTWDLSQLVLTSNIFFDSTGAPDVVGGGGAAAIDISGGNLSFFGTGGFLDSVTGISLNSNEGDWVLRPSAVPVPAAVWLFGTALIGLLGFGKRRKAA